MISEEWKILGTALSALWLLATGFFSGLAFGFSGEASRLERLQLQLFFVLAYIVIGLGPVLMFILYRKRNDPIGYAGLTLLAICAASPLWTILLYTLP